MTAISRALLIMRIASRIGSRFTSSIPAACSPQLAHEPVFTGLLAIPGIGRASGGMRRFAIRRAGAAGFAAEGRVDDPAGRAPSRPRRTPRAARTRSMPVRFTACVARRQDRPLGALGIRIARRDVQRRRLRAAVDHEDGAGHLDAGQVEELVALPELLVRRRFRRPLHHDDAVADGLHHAGPARGELVFRKRVGEERRLRDVPRAPPRGSPGARECVSSS